ncbi:MAG: hypothetical protein IJA91_04365 [Clostridia bacterium]|nr:hypothetical protein [Clostridia bacterium]
MKQKLLCGILAALMLTPAVACTGNDNDTETDTKADTVVTLTETEAPTETPTKELTEEATEPETEPPIEIEVPAYEDIGLTEYLAGTDERVELDYQFDGMTESLSQIKADNALMFTTNGNISKDDHGITASKDVWNAVGFAQSLTEAYTAAATLYNHGDSTSATSSVMFGTRIQTPAHLFIDSGLWVTVNNKNAHLIIHNVLSVKLGSDLGFNAKNGVKIRFEDDDTNIKVFVADQHLATVTVDSAANTVTVFDTAGAELASAKADKLAHGDSPGYVRAMQHFADSSVAKMSLSTGKVLPYAPADVVTELRNGLSYLLCEKVQHRTAYPITCKDGVVLMDAEAMAKLLGFDYTETDNTATLTKDSASLTFTVDTATVDLNGESHAFPTVIKRGGTILIAADYIARWMGYTVKTDGDSVYIAISESKLTKEKVQEMNDRYQMYQDIVYNYDDVEADQTGVGKYEKTPYEDRLVGIAYTTWHSPTFTKWGSGTWDLPLDGPYSSDDRDVIYKHGILLRDAGIDFVFVDWTNNTDYDPATMRDKRADFRMIEEATDALFEVWSTIEGAPKICIFAGPGHNGIGSVNNGNHQKKVDQIHRDYVEKYPDLYFRYEGKPLLMCYGATPNQYGARPRWTDDRFTIRWATGYVGQQGGLFDTKTLKSHSFWSWEERGAQTFTVTKDRRVECITCTAASRAQSSEGEPGYIPAYGRENGMTLKKQFQRANDLGAGMVILVSWNEWTTGEQPSVEVSKDLEPSQVHGTFYYDLLCEQIKKYKGQIPVGDEE